MIRNIQNQLNQFNKPIKRHLLGTVDRITQIPIQRLYEICCDKINIHEEVKKIITQFTTKEISCICDEYLEKPEIVFRCNPESCTIYVFANSFQLPIYPQTICCDSTFDIYVLYEYLLNIYKNLENLMSKVTTQNISLICIKYIEPMIEFRYNLATLQTHIYDITEHSSKKLL